MMSTLRKAAVLAAATPASALTILKYESSDTSCAGTAVSMLDFADADNFNIQSGLSAAAETFDASGVYKLPGSLGYWKMPATCEDGTAIVPTVYSDAAGTTAQTSGSSEETDAMTELYKYFSTSAAPSTFVAPADCYEKGGNYYKLACNSAATTKTLQGITMRVYKEVADSDTAGCTDANEIIQADNLDEDKLDTKLGLSSAADLNSCLTASLSIDGTDTSVHYKMDCTATDAAATITFYDEATCDNENADSDSKKKDAMQSAMKADGVYPTNGVCIKPSGSTTHYKLDCNGAQKSSGGYVTTDAPDSTTTTTSGSVAATVSAVAVTAGLWML
jgi:hypothetical protein